MSNEVSKALDRKRKHAECAASGKLEDSPYWRDFEIDIVAIDLDNNTLADAYLAERDVIAAMRAENERLRARLSEIESAATNYLHRPSPAMNQSEAELAADLRQRLESLLDPKGTDAELEAERAKPVDLRWRQDKNGYLVADLPFQAGLTITEYGGKFLLLFRYLKLLGKYATLDEAKEAANRYVADELTKFADMRKGE